MGAMTEEAKNAFLNLYLNNIDWANVGDAAGLQNSATAGNHYLSLHTAAPAGADQTSNEVAGLTGYARLAVARSGATWTVSAGAATPAAELLFAQITAGTATITHVGLGSASSGAGHLQFQAALTTSRALAPGAIPRFGTSDFTLTLS